MTLEQRTAEKLEKELHEHILRKNRAHRMLEEKLNLDRTPLFQEFIRHDQKCTQIYKDIFYLKTKGE